jgi:hypothetical protein
VDVTPLRGSGDVVVPGELHTVISRDHMSAIVDRRDPFVGLRLAVYEYVGVDCRSLCH